MSDTNKESKLCHHCGDTVLEIDSYKQGDDTYHLECIRSEIPECRKAVTAFLNHYSTDKVKNVMFMGIHVSYLYKIAKGKNDKQDKQEKRRKRDVKLKELMRKVSSLRNTNSGSLIIQLVGKDPSDQFTGAFDEFADMPLTSIIEDGKFFGDVFHKNRMSALKEFRKFTNFIVLRVQAASSMTTSDYKNKVALNNAIVNPSPENMFTFLRDKKKFKEEHSAYKEVKRVEDLRNLEESRSVQFKANYQDKEETLTKEIIVEKLLTELKLKEYISAFTKNPEGGIYLFGVGEKDRPFTTYTSREPDVHGLQISRNEHSNIAHTLKDRVNMEILVCDYYGNILRCQDLLEVEFLPFRGFSDRFVLKISIRPVRGLVFTDGEGPQAYKVDKSDAQKDAKETLIPVNEWFRIIREHNETE